jgi:molybdopterin-guanine dinucleotide biosynthesis protein MobB
VTETASPPAISIVGRKNSGKTTLLVAVAAELGRRGLRVATMKHGHHDFQLDQPGSDSWRHFNEGAAEAVLLVAGDRIALVARVAGADDNPNELIATYLSGRGYDLVLVEGYKHGPFPKIEIHRRALYDSPLYASQRLDAASLFLAVVTDDPSPPDSCPAIALDAGHPDGSHVTVVANLIQTWLEGQP